RPAAQPPLDEVHRAPLEPGERRAEEGEEVVARPAGPREAEERGERLPERRLREAQLAVDGVGDPELAEHRVERGADALRAGDDDSDPLGRGAGPDEREQLLADELERAAAARALEEAQRPLERRRLARVVREETALEMRERRRSDRAVARRQLLDRAGRETGEILGRAGQGRERGASGLVRQRDGDLDPRRERLEQRPFRSGEILEAVCEDGLVSPHVEVGANPLDRAAPPHAPVRAPERCELLPVCGPQRSELAADVRRLEQPRLELVERLEQRVGEAAAGGGLPETVERCRGDDPPDEKRALGATQGLLVLPEPWRDPLEEVVERDDRAAEERAATYEQLPLDAVDIGAIRDDEHRLARLESREVPLEQKLDFARVGGPRDQPERHPPTLARNASCFCERGSARELHPLGLAAAAGDGAAGHRAGALVAEVGLLRAAASVRVGHAQNGALRLLDFSATAVANKNGLTGHDLSSLKWNDARKRTRTTPPFVPAYFAPNAAAPGRTAPPARAPDRALSRPANGAGENRRSFFRRDTARRRPERHMKPGRRPAYFPAASP